MIGAVEMLPGDARGDDGEDGLDAAFVLPACRFDAQGGLLNVEILGERDAGDGGQVDGQQMLIHGANLFGMQGKGGGGLGGWGDGRWIEHHFGRGAASQQQCGEEQRRLVFLGVHGLSPRESGLKAWAALRECERDLGIHAGAQFFVGVGQVDFGAHGSGGGVKGSGDAGDGAGDDLVVEAEEFDGSGAARGDGEGTGFGDVKEDANGVDALAGEEGRGAVGGAGLHEIAATDAPAGDQAVKGGDDFGVLEQGVEMGDFGFGGEDLGAGDGEGGFRGGDVGIGGCDLGACHVNLGGRHLGFGAGFIELLIGDCLGGEEFFLPAERGLGERQFRLIAGELAADDIAVFLGLLDGGVRGFGHFFACVEGGLGDAQLALQLRVVDGGEDLALFDVVAHVDFDFQHVAGVFGVEIGGFEGFEAGGKGDGFRGGGGGGGTDRRCGLGVERGCREGNQEQR